MPVVIGFILTLIAWKSFGNKVLRPTAEFLNKIYENDKIDFLDNEADVKSSIDVTKKYTGPKKGTVQIGKFRVGIIPLIIVALLLIKKIRK